jgi:hypothetical protein
MNEAACVDVKMQKETQMLAAIAGRDHCQLALVYIEAKDLISNKICLFVSFMLANFCARVSRKGQPMKNSLSGTEEIYMIAHVALMDPARHAG